jgi:phage gpG-like protein
MCNRVSRVSEGGKMSHRGPSRVNRLLVAAAALAVGSLLSPAGVAGARPGVAAHAASVLSVHDEGRLRFVHASGSVIIDEGSVSGTFPGSVRVRFLYDGEPDVSAQFTITGHGGSISARGTGRLSSPTSPSPSFAGHMTVTGGSGRYAHIHGSGTLYGVYNRRSYALTVQAVGKLPY